MSHYTLPLTEELYHYALSISLREHPVLAELRGYTRKDKSHYMQISPDQGQCMSLLAKLMQVKKALEIGVYTGYSALAVALALPEDGELVACEVSTEWVDAARHYWREANVDHKIKLHIAPAEETLKKLLAQGEANSFDFVFIDADKKQYDTYYELCLQLLRPGGAILIDNVFRGGKVLNPAPNDLSTQAIVRLNQKLHQDPRIDLALLPIGDGLTMVRKR